MEVKDYIVLEHCRCRDVVYIFDILEVCGPLQKDKVKVGDTGIFFDSLNDLVLLSTYKIDTVTFINEPSNRYFLPIREVPDDLYNL